MANNHGGIRKGQGRKSKAEELKAIENGLEAIIEAYGSVSEYWVHIATKSKESFPHMKLLHEYIYGKARETKDISIETNSDPDFLERLMSIPVEEYTKLEKEDYGDNKRAIH